MSPLVVPSNGSSRKRKDLSGSEHGDETSDVEQDQVESDTVESEKSHGPAKRVKIESRVDEINDRQLQSDLEESESGSEESRASDQGAISSEEEDESDAPGFFGADSGSEFGDVDEGEAELERLLAMANEKSEAQADLAAVGTEENEPQSFSRIPPQVLHRCLGMPDDPSRPMPRDSNTTARARTKQAIASEPLLAPAWLSTADRSLP